MCSALSQLLLFRPSCSCPIPSTSHGERDRSQPDPGMLRVHHQRCIPTPRRSRHCIPLLRGEAEGSRRPDPGHAAQKKGLKRAGDTLCLPPPPPPPKFAPPHPFSHQEIEAFSANDGLQNFGTKPERAPRAPAVRWGGTGDAAKPARGAAHRGQRRQHGLGGGGLTPIIPLHRPSFCPPPTPGENGAHPRRAEPAGTQRRSSRGRPRTGGEPGPLRQVPVPAGEGGGRAGGLAVGPEGGCPPTPPPAAPPLPAHAVPALGRAGPSAHMALRSRRRRPAPAGI